jgi:hypothetical protein
MFYLFSFAEKYPIYLSKNAYSLYLGNFLFSSQADLSIFWKSKNLNFGQESLNITHCAAPQVDIEPRQPGLDSTLQPFVLSSAAWNTTDISEN